MAGTIAADAATGLDSGPISFGLRLDRAGSAIRVAGWMHAIVACECSRCLEGTRLPVRREMDIEFRPWAQAPEEEETELDAEDLDIDYYPENGLDFRAVLVEQILLGIPMKILCGEDCKGLCPQCGVDRNLEPCDCEPPPDPRLADLAKLRDQL